nr:MAG TPA: PAB-dependent polyA-specific ribonuclease subunit [Caudoviricetes sp.]
MKNSSKILAIFKIIGYCFYNDGLCMFNVD